jgi:hypothetical protein
MVSLHLKISLAMAASIALSVALFTLLTWFKIENTLQQLARDGGPDMAEAAEQAGRRMLNAMLGFALPCIGGLLLPAWIGCRLIFQPLRHILAEAERTLDEGSTTPPPPGLAGELRDFGLRLRQAAEERPGETQ